MKNKRANTTLIAIFIAGILTTFIQVTVMKNTHEELTKKRVKVDSIEKTAPRKIPTSGKPLK